MKLVFIKNTLPNLTVNQNHYRTNQLRNKLISMELGFCGGKYKKEIGFVVEYKNKKEIQDLSKEMGCRIKFFNGMKILQEPNSDFLEYCGKMYAI